MRIVSLSPSFTEILQALGQHENLAGVTDECPQGLTRPVRLGAPNALRLSEIKKLSPELILTERRENRPEEIREIEKEFKVRVLDVTSIPSVIAAISETGKWTQSEEAAKELIRRIYQEWPAPSLTPVKTAVLIWNNPITTVSSRHYISNLIEAAGGWNLYREDPVAEVAIELEEMMDLAPEVLLLPSSPYSFSKKDAEAFKNFPVFHQKKVELIDGVLFSRFGPRTVEALKLLKSIFAGIRRG